MSAAVCEKNWFFAVPCDFQCSDDECVPQNENLNYVCDGVMDCANGLDEVDCDDNGTK